VESQNEKSPEVRTPGLAGGKTRTLTSEGNFSRGQPSVNGSRFLDLLETHVSGLTVRGHKATGRCPLHPDCHPSFTADLEKLVWYCFPCARGGGVKDFAVAVGEQWGTDHYSLRARARIAVQSRRRTDEGQARAILQKMRDQEETQLWAAWGEASTTANEAADLLSLFFRRPDLAEEFPDLVATTAQEYADATWTKMLCEQRIAGEVSHG
jgi:hypothetical protein